MFLSKMKLGRVLRAAGWEPGPGTVAEVGNGPRPHHVIRVANWQEGGASKRKISLLRVRVEGQDESSGGAQTPNSRYVAKAG
jgi:hypothetical protein